MRTIVSAVVAACLVLTASYVGAQTSEGREISLKIDAETLAGALDQWAAQTGVQFVSPSWEVAKKISATPLKGRYTARAALEKLLDGTPLICEWMSDKAVAIREKSSAERRSSNDGRSETGQSVLGLAPVTGQTRFRVGGEATVKPSASSDARALPSSEGFEEIVVTGTHIRGVTDVVGPTVVLDRAYIDRTGYMALRDVLGTMSQNFSGGVNEGLGTTETDALNVNQGSAVNLRGLGAAATLVLVNGHRVASSGLDGAFVDISNIPTSAIERIEVLTDGASAIYGSDAIGGVVNIILRDEFEGAETRVRLGRLSSDVYENQASQLFGARWDGGNLLTGYQYYSRDALPMTAQSFSANSDQRPRGGDNFSTSWNNPGNILSPFTGLPEFAIPAGQSGSSLSAADLLPGVVNYANAAEFNDLLAQQKMHSVFTHASQSLTSSVKMFFDGHFSTRDVSVASGSFPTTLFVPDSNPFFVTPYDGIPFVLVDYDLADDLGRQRSVGETVNYEAQLGAMVSVARDWRLTTVGSYARQRMENDSPNYDFLALEAAVNDPNPATAFNAFGDGSNTNPATLESIRAHTYSRGVTRVWSANALADGPLFTVPAGDVKLAIGADYRAEQFETDFLTHELGLPDTHRSRDRHVQAAFAELAIPLLGTAAQRTAMQLSLAARYERYSDFGESLDPRIGLSWSPLATLTLRGTWGTSFRAPRLGQLDEDSTAASSALVLPFAADPQSPSGISNVLFLLGNNSQLQEETARTWSFGVDFVPADSPRSRVSITYYDIDYKDRIARPGPLGFGNILLQEEQWAEVIRRNPSQAEIDAICDNPRYGIAPGTCAFSPPVAIVDIRLRNIAQTRTSGLDLSASQLFESRHGDFSLDLHGTYVLEFEQALSATSPLNDLANTVGNPLKLRIRGSAGWNSGPWGLFATVNFANDYRDELREPSADVGSWTTVDLQATYTPTFSSSMLNDLSISLSALNVFDKDPPFVNYPVGFDPSNAQPYGRTIGLQVSKGWGPAAGR
jgi:iron complex outermembrane recepter protein